MKIDNSYVRYRSRVWCDEIPISVFIGNFSAKIFDFRKRVHNILYQVLKRKFFIFKFLNKLSFFLLSIFSDENFCFLISKFLNLSDFCFPNFENPFPTHTYNIDGLKRLKWYSADCI